MKIKEKIKNIRLEELLFVLILIIVMFFAFYKTSNSYSFMIVLAHMYHLHAALNIGETPGLPEYIPFKRRIRRRVFLTSAVSFALTIFVFLVDNEVLYKFLPFQILLLNTLILQFNMTDYGEWGAFKKNVILSKNYFIVNKNGNYKVVFDDYDNKDKIINFDNYEDAVIFYFELKSNKSIWDITDSESVKLIERITNN